MSYTILRPVSFMENIADNMHGRGFARMWEQMGPNEKLQLVSTKDIGFFAAQSFLDPQGPRWKNQAISLAGDELSQVQADKVWREVMDGSPMPMAPCLIESAVKYVLRDTVGDVFTWFETKGYGADVEECRGLSPGMQSFKDWVVENKEKWAQCFRLGYPTEFGIVLPIDL